MAVVGGEGPHPREQLAVGELELSVVRRGHVEGDHPIVPIMLYEAPLAQQMASRLLELGIYVIGFFYPVVPEGQARIRTQVFAAHTREHLDNALEAFTTVGRELVVIR